MAATLRSSSGLSRALRRSGLVAVCLGAFAASLFSATGVVQLDGGPAPQKKERKPSPPLSSLPAPRAAGAPKILLVDDDYSSNNHPGGSKNLSASDAIFRQLVRDAVGGDDQAWSTVVVDFDKAGPTAEQMRGYNVVLWYNGGSYGGGYDNAAVLSLADEPNVRRYLEETGGSFILISPGYVNAFSYGNTWEDAPVAFLTEVVGINGFKGLAKRFAEGVVAGADGSSFTVEAKGAIEPIFSAVNPDGAAVVFTSSLDPKDPAASGGSVVAVANPFGGGRFTYVGFSFENIGDKDRAKAFASLLAAAGAGKGGAAASAPAAPATAATPGPAPGGVQAFGKAMPPPLPTAPINSSSEKPLTSSPEKPLTPVGPLVMDRRVAGGTLPQEIVPAPGTPLPGQPLTATQPLPSDRRVADGKLPQEIKPAPAATTPAATSDSQRVTQAFTLFPRERVSLAVPVVGAGPIDVQVDSQGGAISAVLTGPDGRTTRQTGTGSLKLHGDSTAAAGGEAELWRVVLQEANPPKAPAKVLTAPQPFATGSITVQAPRAPEPATRAAADKLREIKLREQASLVLQPTNVSATVAALQAQLTKQTADRQAALLERSAPLLPVAVANLAKQRIAGRSLGQPLPEPLVAVPVTPFQTSTYTPTQLVDVTQLSVTEGDPGTPVVIDGAGFGGAWGEVHFQVSADKDLPGRVLNWTPTRILVEVPAVSGVFAYDGTVYVKAQDGRVSSRKAFKFQPELVYSSFGFPAPADQRIGGGEFLGNRVRHWDFLFFFGNAGYDEYYFNSTLQNGWVVESATAIRKHGYGDAYVVDIRPGTASPYIKVRWWVDAMDAVAYDISIVVKGPKGVPFF